MTVVGFRDVTCNNLNMAPRTKGTILRIENLRKYAIKRQQEKIRQGKQDNLMVSLKL